MHPAKITLLLLILVAFAMSIWPLVIEASGGGTFNPEMVAIKAKAWAFRKFAEGHAVVSQNHATALAVCFAAVVVLV